MESVNLPFWHRCSGLHCIAHISQWITWHWNSGPPGTRCNLTEHQIDSKSSLIATSFEVSRDCAMVNLDTHKHTHMDMKADEPMRQINTGVDICKHPSSSLKQPCFYLPLKHAELLSEHPVVMLKGGEEISWWQGTFILLIAALYQADQDGPDKVPPGPVALSWTWSVSSYLAVFAPVGRWGWWSVHLDHRGKRKRSLNDR